MRVQFLQSVAAEAWSHDAGDVIEAPDVQARAWLKARVVERTEAPVGRAALTSACPRCGTPRSEFQSWCPTCGGIA